MTVAIIAGTLIGRHLGIFARQCRRALMWIPTCFGLAATAAVAAGIYLFRDFSKLGRPERRRLHSDRAVIGAFRWMPVARLVRAQFLSLREKEFVGGRRALGATTPRLVIKHILPNALGAGDRSRHPSTLPAAIIAESTLSFSRLAFRPDIPTGADFYLTAKDTSTSPRTGRCLREQRFPDRAHDQFHRRRIARRARSQESHVMLHVERATERDAPAGEPALLETGLKTHFATDDGIVQAVDGVDPPSIAARPSASSASPAAARPSPRCRS